MSQERLDPYSARWFVRDVVMGIRERAGVKISEEEQPAQYQSPEEEMFGRAWKFFFGVSNGMRLVERRVSRIENSDRAHISDRSWEDHYEEFGYGMYGVGLSVGKRLSYRRGRDFEFSDGSGPSSDFSEPSEYDFDFSA